MSGIWEVWIFNLRFLISSFGGMVGYSFFNSMCLYDLIVEDEGERIHVFLGRYVGFPRLVFYLFILQARQVTLIQSFVSKKKLVY
ncbi:hypothetical protein QBC38DRAFT_171102 [Podospora fimiseda]|uniref:Transmembrane protein n=1 Tax=Podospora fimiseda TaxID=252190 RepID=A0AAN7BQT2_9PEZI|nr:hypothetical protein QBC38DRAFT_171102 [Podospora fimiseda]